MLLKTLFCIILNLSCILAVKTTQSVHLNRDSELDAMMMDPFVRMIVAATRNINTDNIHAYMNSLSELFGISPEEVENLLEVYGHEDLHKKITHKINVIQHGLSHPHRSTEECDQRDHSRIVDISSVQNFDINDGIVVEELRENHGIPISKTVPIVEEPEEFAVQQQPPEEVEESQDIPELNILPLFMDTANNNGLPNENVGDNDNDNDVDTIPRSPMSTTSPAERAIMKYNNQRRIMGYDLTDAEAFEFCMLGFLITSLNVGQSIKTAAVLSRFPADTYDKQCKRHAIAAVKSFHHGMFASRLVEQIVNLLNNAQLRDMVQDKGKKFLGIGSFVISFAVIESFMHFPEFCNHIARRLSLVEHGIVNTPGAVANTVRSAVTHGVKLIGRGIQGTARCITCIIRMPL